MVEKETKTEERLGHISKNLEDINDTIKEIWSKPKGIWIATTENIDKDFEETRRCLLNSYHSYVQTHAGYIIALIIGASTVIYSFNAFRGIGIFGTIAFIALILAILGVSGFIGLRIVYWTLWASVAITLTMDKAINYFNDTNKTYTSKAPNTAIIQNAIDREIHVENDLLPWYKKLALKTAGKSF